VTELGRGTNEEFNQFNKKKKKPKKQLSAENVAANMR
jgi:hypothetical protein